MESPGVPDASSLRRIVTALDFAKDLHTVSEIAREALVGRIVLRLVSAERASGFIRDAVEDRAEIAFPSADEIGGPLHVSQVAGEIVASIGGNAEGGVDRGGRDGLAAGIADHL